MQCAVQCVARPDLLYSPVIAPPIETQAGCPTDLGEWSSSAVEVVEDSRVNYNRGVVEYSRVTYRREVGRSRM